MKNFKKAFVVAIVLVVFASCGGRKDRCPSVMHKINTTELISSIIR